MKFEGSITGGHNPVHKPFSGDRPLDSPTARRRRRIAGETTGIPSTVQPTTRIYTSIPEKFRRQDALAPIWRGEGAAIADKAADPVAVEKSSARLIVEVDSSDLLDLQFDRALKSIHKAPAAKSLDLASASVDTTLISYSSSDRISEAVEPVSIQEMRESLVRLSPLEGGFRPHESREHRAGSARDDQARSKMPATQIAGTPGIPASRDEGRINAPATSSQHAKLAPFVGVTSKFLRNPRLRIST